MSVCVYNGMEKTITTNCGGLVIDHDGKKKDHMHGKFRSSPN